MITSSAESPSAQKRLTFFRTIGGALGTALFGGVFAGRLQEALPGFGGASGERATAGLDPATLAHLPPELHQTALQAIADAIQGVFWWAVPFAVLALLLGILVKEVPLRDS